MVIAIVLLTLGIAIAIAAWAFRRQKSRGAKSLLVFSFALAVWAIAFGLFVARFLSAGLLWLSLIYLSATVAATALLAFALSYTNHEAWLTRWNFIILGIEPVLTQIFFWTSRWQGIFFVASPDQGAALTAGPWYWINATYSDGLLLLALVLLTQTFIHKSKQYLFQSLTIATGIFIPVLIKILSLSGVASGANLELTPVSFAVTGLVLGYSVYRFKLLDLAPIARDVVVESMSDGWMVTDTHNRIVDMNPVAEALIGLPCELIFGQPAEEVLSNWPSLINPDHPLSELETKGSVKLNGEWRYLDVRIQPLKDAAKQHIGNVILWRDVTEKRKSDDARQSARDEMFVLLHSLTGAANQTLNLKDFLTESIYQIVYSFQSQACLIYLVDESNPEGEGPRYYVAAHHGIADDSLNYLCASPEMTEIVTGILERKEPFFVGNAGTEPRFVAPMNQLGIKSLLTAPLLTQGEVLGAISLIRTEGPLYDQEEINRLVVLAEELASLIYGDRQRQLAIVQEERQRLARDLHDSVTQKLYGLVALTEAAQASLETGAAVHPSQVLERIGVNARQALKEMRLFLFEMQPVDLEHEGLVSVLHQRLAAVEGRSDIKARLLADEEINVSLEKQIALYYIAQEALNNILKHANARSVMVRLKNRRTSVVLEVEDDGCGFDQKAGDKGGMGLRNMQERAAAVGGKLEMESILKKGTRIVVTVGKDRATSIVGKGRRNE